MAGNSPTRPKQPADAIQAEKFKRVARELGCEEDEGAFRDVLRKVVQHKQKPLKPAPSKPPRRGHREKTG